jgi:hypothetical protein
MSVPTQEGPAKDVPPADLQAAFEAGATGLEPATSGVTGRRSNQLSYAPGRGISKYGKKASSVLHELFACRGATLTAGAR